MRSVQVENTKIASQRIMKGYFENTIFRIYNKGLFEKKSILKSSKSRYMHYVLK